MHLRWTLTVVSILQRRKHLVYMIKNKNKNLRLFFVLHWSDYAGNRTHYGANQKTARQPFHTPRAKQWSKEHFLLSISQCLSHRHTHKGQLLNQIALVQVYNLLGLLERVDWRKDGYRKHFNPLGYSADSNTSTQEPEPGSRLVVSCHYSGEAEREWRESRLTVTHHLTHSTQPRRRSAPYGAEAHQSVVNYTYISSLCRSVQ